MQNFQTIYKDLLKEKEQMLSSPILKRYLELKKQKSLSLSAKKEMDDIIHSNDFKQYKILLINIENIKNPISEDFFNKITFIQNSSIRPHKLIWSRDVCFLDGSSIFLWYSSLISLYQKGIQEKEKDEAVFDLYRYSLGKDSFQTRFYLLQFALKKSNNAFCDFLGINYYLYKPVSRLNCNSSVLERISSRLSTVHLFSFTSFQLPLFRSFLEVLEEEKGRLLEKESKKEEKEAKGTSKKKELHIIPEEMQKKAEEMVHYISKNNVSSISCHVLFSDGTNMQTWFEKLCNINRDAILSKEEEEVVQKSIYQIILALFNEKTTPLHTGIEIDYGSSLKRVIAYFGFIPSSLVKYLRIPSSILNKIMENKIIPTEEEIDCILSFLQQIPCENVYQQNLVSSARKTYSDLKSLALEGDVIPFVIYGEEKEKEYLAYFEEVPSAFLEKVKVQNYDWYMKCLTYLYICKIRGTKPTTMDYFYDGTIVYKWLFTQNRFLSGVDHHFFTKEQLAMLELVQKEISLIELKKEKESTESIVFSHFDSFIEAFNEAITNNGDIPNDVFLNEVSLAEAWSILYKELENKNLPFTREQIKKIKELRRKLIYLKKKNTKYTENITFGYELTCFADSLHLTLDHLDEFFPVSRSALWHFSSNKVFPSYRIIQTMLASLNEIDYSLYRLDQVEDIKHFKSYLLSIEKRYLDYKELNRETMFASPSPFPVTGNLASDIPKEVIKEVQDTDTKWYKEFERIYNAILECSFDETLSLGDLFMRPWFKEEVYKVTIGNSTKTKENLLHYLYAFQQKVYGKRKERLFLIRFSDLETFIYENKRIPYSGEIFLNGENDGEAFYRMLRDYFYGTKDYYNFLSDGFLEQIKILMQFITACQREKYNYDSDKVVNQKFYLGQRLNNIRICLGFSVKTFPKRLGWDANEVANLYSNRKPLPYEFVSSLLHLFKEMEPNLREDQLKEVQEFIGVLKTGKLDDSFAFKFGKKDTNPGN